MNRFLGATADQRTRGGIEVDETGVGIVPNGSGGTQSQTRTLKRSGWRYRKVWWNERD